MASSEPQRLTGLSPAERHRRVAAGFGEVVAAVDDWDGPTPVKVWAARNVVTHLTGWFPDFLAAGGIELEASSPSDAGPLGAWRAQSSSIQDLLDDEAVATSSFTHPMAGTHPLAEAIDRFYTADVFMHTWDLARAADVEAYLDPAFCSELLEGMRPLEDLLRSSGHYGPVVATVAEDDPAVDRLMAFIGRDPAWRP